MSTTGLSKPRLERMRRTHSSWGFGMAVDIGRNEIFHSPGRFGWTGGLGTTAYTDPAEGMIGIRFTQRMMESPEPPKIFGDFWTLAYGAMEQATAR
jgi:CubicO group peptidase (beta-lactamase class C family)